MKVSKVMRTEIKPVGMDCPLVRVSNVFARTGYQHLMVLDEEGNLCGIVSDRDVLRSISPYAGTLAETDRDRATIDKPVHQVMTRNPVYIHPDQDVYAAIELLSDSHFSCLPVIDSEGKPVGLLTWRDIFRVIADQYRQRKGKLPEEGRVSEMSDLAE